MSRRVFAEDVRYWRTRSTSADQALDQAAKLIEGAGGKVMQRGSIMSGASGALALSFSLGDDVFRVVWPILPVRRPFNGCEGVARRQAASFLLAHVKARVSEAEVLGMRTSFLPETVVDGRTFAEIASESISEASRVLSSVAPRALPAAAPAAGGA